jgi:mRNA interferase MazF
MILSMEKDFWRWHNLKSRINDSDKNIEFHEREIWFCSIGTNVGREFDGKSRSFSRPILILKKFNLETFWGIPFTSKLKTGKYYLKIESMPQSNLVLSQLRLWDKRRLIRKMLTITEKEFETVKLAIKNLL